MAHPRESRRPDREVRIRAVSRTLKRTYRSPRLHNKRDPLNELVFIVLSAKTAERRYLRTYAELRRSFPGWWSILRSRRGAVAKVIAAGGLAIKKENQLRGLLTSLETALEGRNLSGLRTRSTSELESFLVRLPGVGLKSARCVLMYSLDRAVFPVDTHCRRVLGRVGVIEPKRLTDSVQNEIQAIVPPRIRYDLHVNLVAHGRAVCHSRRPDCPSCPVSRICDYYARSSPTRSWA
jgi:endonuclease III